MRELWNDFIGSMFNFDGKIWTTLSTLFLRPGRVSKDYVEGKKVRYVPPLRMYFFVSAIYFLVLNYSVGLIMNSSTMSEIFGIDEALLRTITTPVTEDDWRTHKDLTSDELYRSVDSLIKKNPSSRLSYAKFLALKKVEAFDSMFIDSSSANTRVNLSSRGVDVSSKEKESYRLNFVVKQEYDTLEIDDVKVSYSQLKDIYKLRIKPEKIITKQAPDLGWFQKIRAVNMIDYAAVFILGSIGEKKSSLTNKLKEGLSYFSYSMFLIMPISALILYLFYFRKRKKYYSHFVLTVHLHIVIFLTLALLFATFALVYTLFDTVNSGVFPLALLIFALGHSMYYVLSVKNFYQERWWLVFFKTMLMNLIYTFISIAFVALVIVVSIYI